MPTQDASYTDVLEYFRQKDEQFRDVPDAELIEYVGEKFPAFRQYDSFEAAYKTAYHQRKAAETREKIKQVRAGADTPSMGKTATGALLGIGVGGGELAREAGLFIQQAGETFGDPVAQRVGKKWKEYGRGVTEEYTAAREAIGGGLPAEVASVISGAAVSSMPSLVAAWMGGLPVAAGVAGAQSYASAYDDIEQELLRQGVSKEDARKKAMLGAVIDGVVTAGLTMGFGGAERFLAKVGRASGSAKQVAEKLGLKGLMKEWLRAAGTEMPEEGLDELSQAIVEWRLTHPEATWEEVRKEVLKRTAMGAGAGLFLGGAAGTVGAVRTAVGARQIAKEQAQKTAREKEIEAAEERLAKELAQRRIDELSASTQVEISPEGYTSSQVSPLLMNIVGDEVKVAPPEAQEEVRKILVKAQADIDALTGKGEVPVGAASFERLVTPETISRTVSEEAVPPKEALAERDAIIRKAYADIQSLLSKHGITVPPAGKALAEVMQPFAEVFRQISPLMMSDPDSAVRIAEQGDLPLTAQELRIQNEVLKETVGKAETPVKLPEKLAQAPPIAPGSVIEIEGRPNETWEVVETTQDPSLFTVKGVEGPLKGKTMQVGKNAPVKVVETEAETPALPEPSMPVKTPTEAAPAAEEVAPTAEPTQPVETPVEPAPTPVEPAPEVEPVAEEVEPPKTTAEPEAFTPSALSTPQSETAGVTASPTPRFEETLGRVKQFMKRKLTSARGLPAKAYASEQQMQGVLAEAEKDIKLLIRDLRTALREAYGVGRVREAAGGFRRIPPQAVTAMDDYLRGQLANPQVIPPMVRGALDKMRAKVTGLSERIIQKMVNSGAPQELIDTLINNLDVYLTRSYRFFNSKLNAIEWFNKLSPAIKDRAIQLIASNSKAKGNQISLEEAERKLLNWLSDLKDGKIAGGGKLGAKDLSLFMRRKEISPEIRALLGEYHDPMINFARSVSKMSNWLAKQEFLEQVRDAGLGKWLFPEDSAPAGFNTRLAAEGSETMSPLNGLRTSPEIAEVFNEFNRITSSATGFWKGWLRAVATTKIAATVWSLLTQGRNAWGQPFFAGMSGHWRLSKLSTPIRALMEDVGLSKGKWDREKWRAYIKEAARFGIVGDTARERELSELLKDASLQDTSTGMADFSIPHLIKKYGFKVPTTLYKLSDEAGKIYGWENEKVNVRKVHPDWTEEQVKREAANRVRDWYPTYSKAPEIVRDFRTLPIGPFVTFPSEIVRTTVKAVSHSIKEIRSSNPVERKIGLLRLASQLATIVINGFGLAALSRLIYGITKQEDDDVRRFMPPWSKNSQILYTGRNEKGELSFVNWSYQNPYSYLTDPVTAALGSLRNDEPFIQAVGKAVGEFFSPYVSETMLAAAFFDWERNQKQSGGKVYNEQDDLETKAIKTADHFLAAFTPGTINRLRKRIIPSFMEQRSKYAKQLDPAREVLSEVFGVRMESFDFKKALAFKTVRFKADVEDAQKIFWENIRKDNDTVLSKFTEAQEKRYKLWTELHKDTLAALRSGVEQKDIYTILEDMGLSRKNVRDITHGVYNVWMPNEETLRRLNTEKGGTLARDIQNVVREYRQKPLGE